jgi:dTDP-4-dehydrorhamnose 3,5-epimerase
MIEGVKTKALTTHCDDRGYFREIVRDDDNMLARLGQMSASRTYPGVIKAFHWHRKQDDLWYVGSGNVRVVLHDLRADSPTRGETLVLYAGDDNPLAILIPPGVAHGYQVLGNTPALLVYATSEPYDPAEPDEERLPFDDPTIGFDWSIRNR